MKITDPRKFILFGGRIRYLVGCREGHQIFGKSRIYENLGQLREDMDELGFNVSRNLYDLELLNIKNEFRDLKEEEFEINESLTLTNEQEQKLVDAMVILEKTVFAEATTRVIAFPLPRRFQLDHLLKEPEKILGENVFDSLSDLAQNDIIQACRCIAFSCPTAAAFQILRAVEECVRILYKAYFPRKNKERPWGNLTSELKNKPRNPKPNVIILEHLDHLRIRFRNPTDHPEKIYDIEEAEDLIYLSIDIINRIMRDEKVEKMIDKPR